MCLLTATATSDIFLLTTNIKRKNNLLAPFFICIFHACLNRFAICTYRNPITFCAHTREESYIVIYVDVRSFLLLVSMAK